MKQLVVAALCAAFASGAARAQGLDEDTRDRGARQLDGWRDRQDAARDGGRQRWSATSHRHLGGFFRVELGNSSLSDSGKFEDGSSYSLSGPGPAVALHGGGAVAEDVILGVVGWGQVFSNPTLEIGGVKGAPVGSAVLYGLAPELTLYSRPANIFVSIAAGLSGLSYRIEGLDELGIPGKTFDTKMGFGARVAAGKEWWVDDHWGIGLALTGTYSWAKGPEDFSTKSSQIWTYGLGFSATYN